MSIINCHIPGLADGPHARLAACKQQQLTQKCYFFYGVIDQAFSEWLCLMSKIIIAKDKKSFILQEMYISFWKLKESL